jgi:hypothetical protein
MHESEESEVTTPRVQQPVAPKEAALNSKSKSIAKPVVVKTTPPIKRQLDSSISISSLSDDGEIEKEKQE